MKNLLTVVAVCGGMLLTAIPIAAHHSFEAEYDRNKTIQVTGTVTRLDWMNPHARFYIDVKEDAGAVANWNLELASPNVLTRNGWTRNTLKIGEQVTVEGSMAKDG